MSLSLSAWQGATDCRDFIVVCDNSTLRLSANGVGELDFAKPNNPTPPCFQGSSNPLVESNSLWLKVPIVNDGVLEFTIIPENPDDDFDFLLYGPNPDCNALGEPVRCSSTSPVFAMTSLTGLSRNFLDVTEGPGTGDSFVAALDVKAGEEYILLIDRFTQTNNGFTLEWGGDVIAPPPVANSPGNLEFCDPDGDGELVVDISDQSDVILNGQAGASVSFYFTETDAILDQNGLNSRQVPILGGRQTVFARVTNAGDGCSAITSFDVVINTLPIVEPITGPISVCPTVTDIPYSSGGTNVDFYEWIVDGGIIQSGQGTTDILVNWGQANDDAQIKLVGKSNTGCVSDTVFLPVRVNKRLEPELPKGPVDVCYDQRLSTQYAVTAIPGSVYEWGVINGNIVGANDQNVIEVNWDGFSGTGRVFLREFNPTISECEGFSDTLNVQLQEEIIVNTEVVQPRCAGANDGTIRLSVGGGAVGAVNIAWSDIAANTDFRDNLAPNTYNYTITDTEGCMATGTITITEPPPLAVANVTPISTSCFESSDGGITATISGGTGSYRYGFQGQFAIDAIPITGNVLNVQNLPRGDYDIFIVDDNVCLFFLSFTVEGPALLEPDLQSLLVTPACPQSATGEISLEAMGGTPDYQFFWTPDIDQEGNMVTGLNKGDYTVTIMDMNNCQANLTIEVGEVQPRVLVPNAFSPNGDDQNDEFLPVTNCPLANYQFSVFNRWGSLVFSTTDYTQGWDGNLDGEAAPIGRYSYLVNYSILVEDNLIDETIRGVVRVFR